MLFCHHRHCYCCYLRIYRTTSNTLPNALSCHHYRHQSSVHYHQSSSVAAQLRLRYYNFRCYLIAAAALLFCNFAGPALCLESIVYTECFSTGRFAAKVSRWELFQCIVSPVQDGADVIGKIILRLSYVRVCIDLSAGAWFTQSILILSNFVSYRAMCTISCFLCDRRTSQYRKFFGDVGHCGGVSA